MQRIGYHVAISVDGFIAGPNGGFAAFLMTGEHVEDYLSTLRAVGTVIMGRRTYQKALDVGVTDPYPHVDTVVFSRTLATSPHPHVQVVSTDMCAYTASLRGREGNGVCLVGGGQVASQLLRAGLIDELVVKVNPFVLGVGIPLFEGELASVRLHHVASKVFCSGVVVSSYRVHDTTRRVA